MPSRPYIWAFIPQHMDWSAPMVAMQELAKVAGAGSSSFAVYDESHEHILSCEDINNLLSIFTGHYEPWLNFMPVRANNNDGRYTFLDIACCTIASRHVDASSRFLVVKGMIMAWNKADKNAGLCNG
ncbi:hypothetical protein BDZ89DRAFT_1145095 [Hymenopellis radicata]|nr:hypothetical protein BDZ89DRAFT_1145095 [Hymenopellis radicata]